MNEFDYFDMYRLMRKFRDFSKCEVRIMDYLMKNGCAETNYSDLAEIIGMKRSDVSYVRKSVLHLEEMGVISVNRYGIDCRNKNLVGAMKACKLVDGWMDSLLINNAA